MLLQVRNGEEPLKSLIRRHDQRRWENGFENLSQKVLMTDDVDVDVAMASTHAPTEVSVWVSADRGAFFKIKFAIRANSLLAHC